MELASRGRWEGGILAASVPELWSSLPAPKSPYSGCLGWTLTLFAQGGNARPPHEKREGKSHFHAENTSPPHMSPQGPTEPCDAGSAGQADTHSGKGPPVLGPGMPCWFGMSVSREESELHHDGFMGLGLKGRVSGALWNTGDRRGVTGMS